MPTRLLVNAKWRVSPRVSGVQRYAEGLAKAIERSNIDAEFAQPAGQGLWKGMLWEQRTLPRLARDFNALLCPANMAPMQLDESTRLMVTIHCLRFRFHPSSYSTAFVRWYKHMIPRAIERADTIFTVSHAQLSEIESVYPSSIGKIQVIYPGLEPVFQPDLPRDPAAPEGAYLICLTAPAPAKNLSTLIRAYASVPGLPPLVLVGVDEREADLICPEAIRIRVIPLGQMNDTTRIAKLIANAELILAPSRYESFGLPCLEAMGCGTPVIASEIPAHREVCRDAAAYAAPDDPVAWGAQIQSVLGDADLQQRMRSAGLRRSRAFRWDTSVKILSRALKASHASVER